MQRPHKRSLRDLIATYDLFRHDFDYKDAVLYVLAFTIVTVSAMFMGISKEKLYIVKVNDKTIGYVDKYDTYKVAIEDMKSLNGSDPSSSVKAEKVENPQGQLLTSSQIENMSSQELGLKMDAVAMYANGIEIGVVSSINDANKVIEGVKKYYYPSVKNGTFNITSSKIREKIVTKTMVAEASKVLDVNSAIKKIVNGKGAEKTYTIKDGDTIWDIALSNNLNFEDIQAANPKMNLDKIKIGQIIKLAVNLPYVNVELTANIKSKEQIPYETKDLTDKNLRKGSTKIKQRGRNGLAEINKDVKIVNGDIIDENVISSKTLYAAKDEVRILGGKVPMYVATGSFIRPSRGMLTSRFGRRWGKMHEGIDLAGPTGTAIYAADSGKVSFVGRQSGYGLCLLINHGKGLQTLYGHTSKIFVKEGQSVKKGQKIAAVGSTGHVTGPHLHFEVRRNGVPVNPLGYVKIR